MQNTKDVLQESAKAALVASEVMGAATNTDPAKLIIAGEYSVLMACMAEILNNTATLSTPKEKTHLIVDRMWIQDVNSKHDKEQWGQSIDAFPTEIQNFIKENRATIGDVKPGEPLTWAQVRKLRDLMVENLKARTDEFVVLEGKIDAERSKVKEAEGKKVFDLHFVGEESSHPITVNRGTTVLDFTQRPRTMPGNAIHPATLPYTVEKCPCEIPMCCVGSGAQAAWLLDKFGQDRQIHLLYGSTIDARIINALFKDRGNFSKFHAGNVAIKNTPNQDFQLQTEIEKLAGKEQAISYTRDDGVDVALRLTLQQNPREKSPFKFEPIETYRPDGLRMKLGLDITKIHEPLKKIGTTIEKSGDIGLPIGVMSKNDAILSVGLLLNASGFECLNKKNFWGGLNVIDSEDLFKPNENPIVAAPQSLLPGSGIPRSIIMKEHLQNMKNKSRVNCDVNALIFTKLSFNQMCNDFNFDKDFRPKLIDAIKSLKTPGDAGENKITWILDKYKDWLTTEKTMSAEDALHESDACHKQFIRNTQPTAAQGTDHQQTSPPA